MHKQISYLGLLFTALVTAASSPAQTRTLNQGWQFCPDQKEQFTAATVDRAATWRPDQPSLSWNAQFADLRDYAGVGWYRIRIDLPQPQPATRQLIHFGAVDYLTEVWVNGKPLGQHEGGYTPFTFDLTGRIRGGSNEILVKVFDPAMPPVPAAVSTNANPPKTPLTKYQVDYNEIPHGKQNWYVQTSGIWQPVTLETVPIRYVQWLHVTPQNSGNVTVEAKLSGSPGSGPLHATLMDPYGATVAQFDMAAEGNSAKASVHVDGPMLWDGDHPNLYSVVVDNQRQQIHSRFGFRELTTANGRLYLNGKPYYMRAALDQDFYPEGIYTPPSADFIRQEMLAAKAMGLNMLRCHIKVPDPRYLDAADETGLLVWYEIPVWNDVYHWTPEAARRGVETFHAEVERDWNHPSIVIQSIMNEQWGMDNTQQNQRAWLLQTFRDLKQWTAPLGRLITDDSACCKGFHLHSDFADWHTYYSIPDHAGNWAGWVKEYAERPKYLFSSYGDAITTGQEPLLVSEFGNWGLPELPPPDRLPWWFSRDFDGRELTRAGGVLERFQAFGFNRMYSGYGTLARATERHEYVALQYEIEQMRHQAPIQGYVITEFTDANWEANGLMSMWRKPKAFAEDLGALQQDDLVMADFTTHNFSAGAAVELPLTLSHYSSVSLAGAGIEWQTSDGQSGSVPLTAMPEPGGVAAVGTLQFKAARMQEASAQYLRLQLVSAGGKTLAQNRYRFAVYPAAPSAPAVALHDPLNQLGALRAALVAHGAPVSEEKGVWLTSSLDEASAARLKAGGTVLLLADSQQALPVGSALNIEPRAGSDLNGDWVSNFNWALSSSSLWKPLAPVIDESILGWEAASVTPDFVIAGLKPEESAKVLAGVFYGWLNSNRAYLADVPQGTGRLLVTTFRFGSYGQDPFATTLLNQILETANR